MFSGKRYTERRKHERRNLHCFIKFGTQNVITSLKNIAGGGILFKIGYHLPINTLLSAELGLPIIDRKIDVSLEVVRLQKIKGTNKYLVGAKFREIKEEDRKTIIDIVESTKGASR